MVRCSTVDPILKTIDILSREEKVVLRRLKIGTEDDQQL